MDGTAARSLDSLSSSADKWVYPHDNPSHPWHWTRKGTPDSALSKKKDCDGQTYEELYNHFHEYGYIIFRSCTLKDDVLNPLAEYTKSIKESRVQDAKVKSVMDLTVDEGMYALVYMPIYICTYVNMYCSLLTYFE